MVGEWSVYGGMKCVWWGVKCVWWESEVCMVDDRVAHSRALVILLEQYCLWATMLVQAAM